MNSPKHLRKLSIFQLYECDAMKEYLEEMALKGWKLTSFSRLFLYFEQIAPQPLHYSVEIFSKAYVSDSVPNNQTREYIEYCNAAGWEFVHNSGQMVIFVSASSDTTPIETDEREKLSTIAKAIIKQNIVAIIVAIMWIASNAMTNSLTSLPPPDFSFSFILISTIITFLAWLVALYNLCPVVVFIAWYINQKHRLFEGKPIQYISLKKHFYFMVIRLIPFAIFAIVLLIIAKPEDGVIGLYIVVFVIGPIALLILCLILLLHFLSKARLNRTINIIITVVGSIAIVIAVIIVSAGAIFVASTDRERTSDARKYETVMEQNYYGNYPNTYDIFPADIPENAIPEDFYYEYYNPWDACFLIYLNLEFDAENFDEETKRLEAIDSNQDINYGTTGFKHTSLATRSSTEGIVYAIADEENKQIIYVLLQFKNYFTDIDYTKYIPEEYLPTGFNALQGNDRRKAFDENGMWYVEPDPLYDAKHNPIIN